ncbi:heterokaryon incompatibility [Fusarium beomiforme]|uniref:Heterokaryon incompatibility n=1 Tax=Fusarium beomiforme TaxID=44412 RepID=A0A9P5DX29_9HYPO|nr:heterokaryon incompatibility [Fusarium beomiforme]
MSLFLAFEKDSEGDTDERHSLTYLLRRHKSVNFKEDSFWPFDTLCKILTRDRVKKALSELWPRVEVDRYTDLISPVYATAQDAIGKDPVQPSLEPKRFVKVFGILVLLEVPERIKDFIDSDISDNDLPLGMDPADDQARPKIHEERMRSLVCFHKWSDLELDFFYQKQWAFNVAFLEEKGDCNWVDYKTAVLPWRRIPAEYRFTSNRSISWMTEYVEIDAGSHSFHNSLENKAFHGRFFTLRTHNKSLRRHPNFREVSMLKELKSLQYPHVVPLLAAFKCNDGYHLVFPNEKCDIYRYWLRYPGILSDTCTNKLESFRWMSGQMLGIASALDWIGKIRGEQQGILGCGFIQRDDVLWFSSPSDPRGTFAITGFEAPVYIKKTSQAQSDRNVGIFHSYLAPESIVYNDRTQSCDIWALGCFFLEMLCWVFEGIEEIEQFTEAREKRAASLTSMISMMPTFFDILHENRNMKESRADTDMLKNHLHRLIGNQDARLHDYVFIIKPAVTERIVILNNHSACTEYMHDFLELVEQKMLIVNTEKRGSISNIVRALEFMHMRTQGDTGIDYILKPSSIPNRHSSAASVEPIVERWFLHEALKLRSVSAAAPKLKRNLGLGRVLSNMEFRLLKLLPGEGNTSIECTLQVVPLGTDEPYEALSYVWGEASGTIPIKVSGCEVKVTRSLCSALKRLRRPTTARTLWIDQLCINQWDVDEKAEQVKLMRHIYQRCSKCLIWLGEIPTESAASFSIDDARLALSFINDLANVHVRPMSSLPTILGKGTKAEAARKAFHALFMHGNVWWSRIWTVQEAILPPSASIVWGPLSISWETLRTAASNMGSQTILYMPVETREALSQHESMVDNFMYPVRGLEISRGGESPLNMLHRWRYRGATEIRDKLFALMGLFPDIPESSLKPLIGRRGEPHVTPHLPSWALDLAYYDYGIERRPWNWGYHSHRYDRFSASGKLKPDFDGQFTRGVFVDSVLEVGDLLGKETWVDLTDEMLILTVKSWKALLDRFVASQKYHNQGVYAGSGSTDDAFWRTMLGNLIFAEVPVSWASEGDRSAYESFLQHSTRNQVYESLRDMVVNQVFFITACGYIGIGPPNLQIGDEIWVLSGGDVPFVLRRHIGRNTSIAFEIDHRSFIGDAYVHGIMQGEVIEGPHQMNHDVRLSGWFV